MSIRLPSRYEDLNEAYKGRLVPNPALLSLINSAYKSMKISGGIRFLPIYGESGSGKSCAAREVDSHLPESKVILLSRSEIENDQALLRRIEGERRDIPTDSVIVAVVDQFEEIVSTKEDVPSQFIEKISILDRSHLQSIPVIFIWLTTSRGFQKNLVEATSRNRRILLSDDFTISGPEKSEWPKIINETFSFHNDERPLSDFQIINQDLEAISRKVDTIGAAITETANVLSREMDNLQNLSEYRVVMVWPVSDALRSQRVLQFGRPRDGYTLNWDVWQTELNTEDRSQLPLKEFNRARLYFDLRLIPVRVADLHKLCLDLDNESPNLGQTYLERFRNTHLHHIVSGSWANYDYNPVRERESQRAEEARLWYSTITTEPTKLGRRLSKIFCSLGLNARYQEDIKSVYSTVRADVFIDPSTNVNKKQIIELGVPGTSYLSLTFS